MSQMSKDSKMWLIFTVYVMVILPWSATIADFIVRIFYPDIDLYLSTLFWYSVVPMYLFALFFSVEAKKNRNVLWSFAYGELEVVWFYDR